LRFASLIASSNSSPHSLVVSHVPCGKGFCQPQLSSSGVDVREIENQFIGLTSSGYK